MFAEKEEYMTDNRKNQQEKQNSLPIRSRCNNHAWL